MLWIMQVVSALLQELLSHDLARCQPAGHALREPRLHHGKEGLSITNASINNIISIRALRLTTMVVVVVVVFRREARRFLNFKAILESNSWATVKQWIRNPSL